MSLSMLLPAGYEFLHPVGGELTLQTGQMRIEVYYGHENHHKIIHADALEYMDSLDDDKFEAIITLFDKLTAKMPHG
jgi:predicted metal-dependent hydrolase